MTGEGARPGWELRRERGVRFVALAELDAVPGVVHGMSTLSDGDPQRSGGPLRAALGLDRFARAHLDQTHGVDVVHVAGGGGHGRGDALVTCEAGAALEVRVADCVPLFAADRRGRAVGLAHAGWRGTLAGIAARLVAAMTDGAPSRAAELLVWIGPSIGPECFQVGPEVIAPFRERFGPSIAVGPDRVDLWEANRIALRSAGVPDDAIRVARLCTRCRGDLFHSHRGSGGRPGRNLALIALRPDLSR